MPLDVLMINLYKFNNMKKLILIFAIVLISTRIGANDCVACVVNGDPEKNIGECYYNFFGTLKCRDNIFMTGMPCEPQGFFGGDGTIECPPTIN